MTIDLSEQLTDRLRDLANQEGRAPETLVEEAVRLYLDAADISDLQPADIAATQEKLAGELGDFAPWPQANSGADAQEPASDETQ